MKLPEKLKANNYFLFLWALCLIFNIITFLFVYFKIIPTGSTFALKYNVIIGVEWYGNGYNLYQIPFVGLVITAMNYLLGRLLLRRNKFLGQMSAYVSLFLQIALLGSALLLKTVN